MENTESIAVKRGTHPLLTLLVFGAVIAAIVTSGSYFSKQHNAARDLEKSLSGSLTSITAIER
jgi:hypothetical protein